MWTVLRSFESEGEARVVEAFLKAHDVEVQLLGTHTHSGAVAPGSLKTASLRMMVRQEQVAHADQLLKEADSRAHLSVVTESEPPKVEGGLNRKLIILVIIVIAALSYFRWTGH